MVRFGLILIFDIRQIGYFLSRTDGPELKRDPPSLRFGATSA
jgi:hypothetical protein